MRLRLMSRVRRSPVTPPPPPHTSTQSSNERPPPPPTPNPEAPSLLNRLPAELRAQIYEHVFTFDSVRCQDGRWRVYEQRKCFRLAARLGPTLVCKQMRAETLHLLMALNEPVCGNERRDVDLYHEFWMDPRLLRDPAVWAARALDGGRSVFVSPRTVFRLNVWVYPSFRGSMSAGDWRGFERSFAPLVDGRCLGRVVVTLHFVVDYQPLICEYRQQQQGGRAGLLSSSSSPFSSSSANLQFEYGAFEIGLDGGGIGNVGLVRLFDERREGLRAHASHEWALCQVQAYIGRLSEQLRRTEEMAVLVVQMAQVKRVERLSLVMSGHC